MPAPTLKKSKLVIRNALVKDIPSLVRLSEKVYGHPDDALNREMIRGQLNSFPEGQFVAEYEGEIVGHCATFIIGGQAALRPHSWDEITGNGFASRHNPDGDYLYGMEVCVDPKRRGLRIGQRLYDARKRLCIEWELKGIVFGGRMPGFARRKRIAPTPEDYLELVAAKKISDPVIQFHLSNDFEIIGLLTNYWPDDKASGGNATHMLWSNPKVDAERSKTQRQRGRLPDSVRVASVQFQVRKVESFEQYEKQLEYFIDIAADYRADFVVFPEMITVPLLSLEKDRLTPAQSIEHLTSYTTRFVNFLQKLALSYNINIIGGSHPTRTPEDAIRNISYVFLRDGSVYSQDKLHPTPNERYWWNIEGGDRLEAIQTDCGPIGVTICYDTEFPETARHLVDQGALILFVPYCTDERQGHLRLRYCAQARAVENQCYVVTAGMVGNLPDVENMDIHYAESGIYTPCDFPFARDGIAASADANTESVCFADLPLANLFISRNSGTVQNLKDRRFDLYRIKWR